MIIANQPQNFYSIVVNNALDAPNKKIIFEEELKITNRQFLEYVDTIASYLQEIGIKKNDKVALMLSNSWQFVANFFAINKIGGVIVTVNNFLKEDEVAYILNDSQAKLLFASGKFDSEVRDLLIKTNIKQIVWVDNVPLENDKNIDYAKIIANPRNTAAHIETGLEELALIIYTSGTTGKPKGAMLSCKNNFSNIYSCMKHLGMENGKIAMICYLPMFHAFTLTVTVILPIMSNGELIIIRSIATKGDFAKVLKHILFKRVPFFCGVPDVYSALAKTKLPWYFHWFHCVKGFISGASPLSQETMSKFAANFKRGVLLQGYGITECSPVVSVNQPQANRIGSVGRPLPGYEVAIFDNNMHKLDNGAIGEICVKGDCVMKGYYNRPEETAEVIIDGWFKTGDIGKIDADGFIYIVDRKKDLIISKGMNIYPREIEEIIYTHEKVNACAVVGVCDEAANEIPVAYVELREDVTATEEEIKAYIKPHLASFKQPRKIYFMEKLPRNATGKILKRVLHDLANKKER